MAMLENPPKMKLSTAANEYFDRCPGAMTVGFMTKEGREFWFRRNLLTGEAVKITRQEAEKVCGET